MTLSASIPILKSKAKKLRRAERIPLCEALDRIAMAEGYHSWSLLVARAAARKSSDLLARLDAGDLVLVGARPGHGKTLCALQLLLGSLRRYQQGWFFSLQNDAPDIDAMCERMGEDRSRHDNLVFEHSDDVCARYIIEKAREASTGAVLVVDHLQLLDQRRKAPALQQQVSELAAFAKHTGCIIVFISQIRSAFDEKKQRVPCTDDIRLLDALDLDVFDKLLFLRDGRVRLVTKEKQGSRR